MPCPPNFRVTSNKYSYALDIKHLKMPQIMLSYLPTLPPDSTQMPRYSYTRIPTQYTHTRFAATQAAPISTAPWTNRALHPSHTCSKPPTTCLHILAPSLSRSRCSQRPASRHLRPSSPRSCSFRSSSISAFVLCSRLEASEEVCRVM